MFMVLVGMLQGAMLFGGLSLALTSLISATTNWGFVVLLTMIGAVLGALGGIVLRSSEPTNVWVLPLGSITVAMVVGIVALAFDFLIFGSHDMHWRAIVSLALIASAPGLMVGWVLAHQFAPDDREPQAFEGASFSGRREASQTTPYGVREPLPVIGSAEDARLARQQHLFRLLEAEASQFPSAMQVDAPQPLGDAQQLCLVASLTGRGASYKFYFVCSPNYPSEPPELLIEQVDRLQGSGGQELQYFSQVIQQWTPSSRLRQVAEELYQAFGRR